MWSHGWFFFWITVQSPISGILVTALDERLTSEFYKLAPTLVLSLISESHWY